MKPAGPQPLLSVERLRKRYGGVEALCGVSLSVQSGQVHAVVGKNGAGKSTLVNVLCGAVEPDAGAVYLDGKRVRFISPLDALKNGVVTVHQETHIVPDLTIADNIMLGRWATRHRSLDRKQTRERAKQVLARLDSPLDPDQVCTHLSIASWQVIEIARALSQQVKVLVLDEPTSALGITDADVLLRVVRSLADTGVGVIYVTHRLDEIPRVAELVTVMREGNAVDTVDGRTTRAEEIVALMVASAASRRRPAQPEESRLAPPSDTPVLAARNIRVRDRLFGVDLDLYPGEILGLAGLVGSGRSELLKAIYGALEADGDVTLDGKPIVRRTPARLQRAGVAFVPDDRKREGLFPELSVADNISLGNARDVSRLGVISRPARAHSADNAIEHLGIKVHGRDQNVESLSGGNQQKVVIARSLAGNPRVLLLDEPTRGVDVDAKFQIYELLRTLRDRGLSIIVAPSEFDEFRWMCNRILVMRRGRAVALVDGKTPPRELVALATSSSARANGDVRASTAWGPREPGEKEAPVSGGESSDDVAYME